MTVNYRGKGFMTLGPGLIFVIEIKQSGVFGSLLGHRLDLGLIL